MTGDQVDRGDNVDEGRAGWAVAIRAKDGTTFLACATPGVLPAVWTRAQRRFAVQHKRELVAQGFRARVVRVRFHDVRAEA